MLYDLTDIQNVKKYKIQKKIEKSSNSDIKLISTSIIIIQKGLYKSIDHQIQIEITVIMQRVEAQQHMC